MGEPQPWTEEGAALRWALDQLRGLVHFGSTGDVFIRVHPTSAAYHGGTELAGFAQRFHQAEDALALVDTLRAQLAFIRDDWSPYGARACPACVYEAGVFIRRCKIHEYADALREEVATAKRRLTFFGDADALREENASLRANVGTRDDLIAELRAENVRLNRPRCLYCTYGDEDTGPARRLR